MPFDVSRISPDEKFGTQRSVRWILTDCLGGCLSGLLRVLQLEQQLPPTSHAPEHRPDNTFGLSALSSFFSHMPTKWLLSFLPSLVPN